MKENLKLLLSNESTSFLRYNFLLFARLNRTFMLFIIKIYSYEKLFNFIIMLYEYAISAMQAAAGFSGNKCRHLSR